MDQHVYIMFSKQISDIYLQSSFKTTTVFYDNSLRIIHIDKQSFKKGVVQCITLTTVNFIFCRLM